MKNQRLRELRDITTFEESLAATKLISGAVHEGLLDDCGDEAEIEPTKMLVDLRDNHVVGYNFTLRCRPENIREGVLEGAGFRLELKNTGSNVHILHSMNDGCIEGGLLKREFTLVETA